MTALFLLLSCTPKAPEPPPLVDPVKATHPGHWKRLDNLNFGHTGMVLGVDGDQVLIFGGFSPTAERLDLVSEKVLAQEPAPFALQHAAAVSLESGVLILGGLLPDETLSTQALRWTAQGFETIPGLIEPRSQASALAVDGAALVCGGQGASGPLSTCEVSTGGASKAGPTLPHARTGGLLVELDGQTLMVGGQGSDSEEIWVLEGASWTRWAKLQTPRWEHAVVPFEGALWVIGGREESGALSSVEICTQEGCEPGPTMSEARSGLNAGVVGGGPIADQPGGSARIVAFGGSPVPDSPDALSSRTVELLAPGQPQWELGERTGQARRGALLHDPNDGTLIVVGGENRGKLSTAVSRYSPLDKPPRVVEPMEEEPLDEAPMDGVESPSEDAAQSPPSEELPSAP